MSRKDGVTISFDSSALTAVMPSRSSVVLYMSFAFCRPSDGFQKYPVPHFILCLPAYTTKLSFSIEKYRLSMTYVRLSEAG